MTPRKTTIRTPLLIPGPRPDHSLDPSRAARYDRWSAEIAFVVTIRQPPDHGPVSELRTSGKGVVRSNGRQTADE